MSNRKINPFVVTGKIEPEYFCDRESESARLIKSIANGNNSVVISPRRMGKTGLIQFCYDKEEIGRNYYTFLSTSSTHRACANLLICSAARYTRLCCHRAKR